MYLVGIIDLPYAEAYNPYSNELMEPQKKLEIFPFVVRTTESTPVNAATPDMHITFLLHFSTPLLLSFVKENKDG